MGNFPVPAPLPFKANVAENWTLLKEQRRNHSFASTLLAKDAHVRETWPLKQ